MFKKVLSLALVAVLALAICLSLASCAPSDGVSFEPVAKEDLKIGLITIHDNSSTYDKNFIDSMYRALANLGIDESQLYVYTGVPETEAAYDAAKKCVNQGCQVVFADSFGHESFILEAAMEFPNVHFCHATGTMAHTANVDNFSDAFASIYQGRYAVGVAAGMKLNEMIEAGDITPDQAVMGYVGAYTYAEVMSGYTSFFLGARSVCPSVTMKVTFTGAWYDYDKEKTAAETLIEQGCVLISQHADSYGAPVACEDAGVPNVSYNGTTASVGPDTYIVHSKIDWTPYFEYMINCTMNGEAIDKDWVGTIANGAVVVDGLNTAVAAAGTKEALDDVIEKLKNGTIKVFDTSTFTVGGQALTEYMADVDTDPDYTKDTQVIANGEFQESKFRSAPYFDVKIDGIILLGEEH